MYQNCQKNTKNTVNAGFFRCVLSKDRYKIVCKIYLGVI
jgi:hypothetical protein